MKKYSIAALAVLLFAFSLSTSNALAGTPSLSVAQNGSGDSEIITISNANANAAITLEYYSNNGSGMQSYNLGTTNSAGQFWTVVTTSSLNLNPSNSVYVLVGGLQSNSASWPYTNGSTGTTGSIYLSQTSFTLTPGQITTATVNNASGLYLSNNSNPSIANISLNGNVATINAISNGSTVITLCAQGTNNSCVNAYVSVQASGGQALSFSQNNITVASGQTTTLTVSGGTGIYTIMNNSNPSAITATINGSVVTLYGGTAGTGNTSITICSTDNSSCGIISASIGTVSSTGVTFDQPTPILSMNQSLPVTIYGGTTGSYYVSNNTNPSIVSTSLVGNIVTLYGNTQGTATITVCSSGGATCGSFTATVNSGGGTGNITLNQTTLSLLVGQTISVTVSGGTLPYTIVAASGNNVAQASLNSNVVNVTGSSAGTATFSVCSASGGCTYLTVTVNGSGTGQAPVLSQSSESLAVGQTATVTVSGNGGYYVSGNTNPSVVTTTVNGSVISLYANTAGQTTITICQTGGQCVTEYVTVGGSSTGVNTGAISFNPVISVGQRLSFNLSSSAYYTSYYVQSNTSSNFSASISGTSLTLLGVAPGVGTVSICASNTACVPLTVTVAGTVTTPTTPPASGSNDGYQFTKPLSIGASGTEVLELQKRLIADGYLNATATGYYGNATAAAVAAYQRANGLTPLGSVGPGTRAALNN